MANVIGQNMSVIIYKKIK